MNQILMTEAVNKNARNKSKISNSSDITAVVRFFAIIIMVFGLALSGSSAFGMVQNIQENKNKSIPVVSAERNGNSVKVIVKNDIGIKTIKYSWNDSTETVVQGRNKNQVETTINIIPGNNKLNMTVIDSNNGTTTYVKNYVQEEKDTTEPVITVQNEDPRIKITVTDDTALDYIIYKYGDNEEVKVEASEDNPTKIEAYIDNVLETQVTLKIEAVDKAQNFATKEQQVKGATKPKIEVVSDPTDQSYLIIRASDNEGLRMVVFYINEDEYKTDPNTSLNMKNFEYRQKVPKGETTIKVHAYNLSEQVSEFEGIYTY
ncbi:MAG: hypothetical protein ACLTXD_02740 [Clostridia bacterium]